MIVKNNDFLFVFAGIVLAGAMAFALGSPNANVGLYGVVGLLGVAAVLAIIIKPNFGANILIMAIFTNVSAQLTDHGYPSIVKPLVVIVFGAIMIRNYYAGQLPGERRKTAVIEMFLILYFLAIATSYLVASDKDRAMDEILDFGKDLVIIYAVLFSLREWTTWKQAIWIIILTTTALSILGVYQIVTHNYSQEFFRFSTVEMQGVFDNDNSSTARIGGPVHDPNYWAQVLVAVIPLVVFQVIHEQRLRWKLLGIGILGVLCVVLLNTYSRGGYLALIVVLILIFLIFEKHLNPVTVIATLAFLLLALSLLPSRYIARFESLAFLNPSSQGNTGIFEDSSLQGRSSVMRTGLTMFSYHPLLGVGAGNFRNNYKKYNQILGIEFAYGEREAHSLYAQVLAETGAVGSFAFLGIVISLMSGLSRSVRVLQLSPASRSYIPWVVSLQVSILGYLVTATFLHDAYIRYFWILVALSLTAIQLIDEQIRGDERINSAVEVSF